MPLYPKAIHKLIPPGPTDPRLDVVVGSISHVAVSEGDSLYNWFNGPSGGVESHFYIRYTGVVEQYRDTYYEADAQGAGNSWVIGNQRYGFVSIETEGMGSGTWTDPQLASLKDLIRWVNQTHGSPWQKAPAYHGRGHGYHSQFPEWNRDQHACPGAARIAQFNNIIVPWLDRNGKEIDLPLTDAEFERIADTVLKRPVKDFAGNDRTVGEAIGITLRNTGLIASLEQSNSVDKIVAATIAAMPSNTVNTDQLATALAKAITELATG